MVKESFARVCLPSFDNDDMRWEAFQGPTVRRLPTFNGADDNQNNPTYIYIKN